MYRVRQPKHKRSIAAAQTFATYRLSKWMAVCSMRAAVLVALLAAFAASAYARDLLQDQQIDQAASPAESNGNGAGPTQNTGKRRGREFHFKGKNVAEEFDRIEKQHGQGLIDRIISNSDYKGGRSRLARDLQRDDDMGLDLDAEAVIYVCEGLAANITTPEAAEIAAGVGPGDADPLASSAWTLSSRPTSAKKLWLDFRGGDVTGSAWNAANGITTITIPPYDKDNNPASFSTAELNDIVAIWRAVAEDYSPFDIDITTIPQTGTSPSLYQRVMIGGNGAWNGGSAGGVSYVGVFGRPDTYYQPTFVFPLNLGPNYAKYIWEAVSHESGHSMGLNHDGTASTGYWQGNSANYGAIMGAGYYSQLTVWDKGEYVGANNQQDDTAIIAGKLGYIAEENGNTIATATPLTVTVSGSTATGTGSGVIAQQDTPDVFRFSAGAGTATINLKTVIPWASNSFARSDLDAKIVVYNPTGTAITTINPTGVDTTNGLGVSGVTVILPAAGTYYLAVFGAGIGVANSDTGYSSYGIRGQFSLNVTFPASAGGTPPPTTPPPAPTLSPSPRPSPSPVPAPAPSPAPPPTGTQGMSVRGSMSCSYTTSTTRIYTCTGSATVRTTSGTAIQGATVTGRYTTQGAATGFPTALYSASTDATGKATLQTAPPAPQTAVSETLTITSVTKTGYTWTGPLTVTMTF